MQSTSDNSAPNGPNCVKSSTYGPNNDSGTAVIDPSYTGGAISISKKAMRIFNLWPICIVLLTIMNSISIKALLTHTQSSPLVNCLTHHSRQPIY